MLFVVLAVPVSRRSTAPGADLELLVLAPMRDGCVGVDFASGAFVRAAYPMMAAADIRPFTVAKAPIVGGDDEPDPVHPEAVTLADLPVVAGHCSVRRAERWLRPLVHPRRRPLLGITGPAVPFWELDGRRPSVALVEPDRGPLVHSGSGGRRCRFAWRGLWYDLPLVGPPCGNPRRMLVALTPPIDGYCYKVVAALLP